jgi:hypothetical protein
MKNYTNIIDYSNLNIAVCDIINKKEGVYHSFFENFEPFIHENFQKNYDKLYKFAENKKNEFIHKPVIITTAYQLNLILDYEKIIEKLQNCKLKINLII